MQNSAGFLFYFFLFFYNFEKILLIGNSKTDNTMQNKLQELTERLYNEGLSKGKQEAEEIKASAIRESEKIISDAQKVAEGIVENARKEAEEIRVRVENDLKMASGQAMATMPIMIPLSDLVGMTRQTAVLAFQIGDGVTNLIYPTLGGMLAMLALTRVPFDRWFRFAFPLVIKVVLMSWIFLVVAVQIGWN